MKLSLTVILLGFVGLLSAQTFQQKNFQVEDGLLSSQVYDITQDPKGNLWIATDLGISRYDGYSFTSFTEKEGLADNAIMQVVAGKGTQVWCMGSNGSISIIDSMSISPYAYEQKLLDSLGLNFIRSAFVDEEGGLQLGIAQPCFSQPYQLILSSSGELTRIQKKPGFYYDAQTKLFGGNGCIGQSVNVELNMPQSAFLVNLQAEDGSLLSIASAPEKAYLITDKKVLAHDLSSEYYLSSTPTGQSLVDRQNNLWVCTYSGILCFLDSDLNNEPIQILRNNTISSVFEDRNGSIWIGTRSKGLYFIKNVDVLVFNYLNEIFEPNINTLTGSGSQVFFSDTRNNLYEMTGKEVNSLGQASSLLLDVIYYQGSPLFAEGQRKRNQDFVAPRSAVSLSSYQNRLWLGTINGFKVFEDGEEILTSSEFSFSQRVNALVVDGIRSAWLGTLNGLYRLDGDSVFKINSTDGLRIDKIQLREKDLVFSSRGNGIGILTDSELTLIGESEGLISQYVNDLFCFENEIWVATNAGASRIRGDQIKNLSTKDGLPTSEINQIWGNSEVLYLGTRKGLVTFNKRYMSQESAPLEVEIKSILLGDQALDFLGKEVVLPYEQNALTIELLARDFRIGNPIRYRYRTSHDSSWSYTLVPEVKYASLPPGEWTFYCAAQNESGQWGPSNELFRFEVEKPYYLQAWFWALLLLSGLGAGWLYVQWRYQAQRKKELTQNELNVLKIKALSSQMNPHFIFNSLNSIQNFLVDNDVRMSNKYLSKFARLMRLILNNSNDTFVPLKDVLSTLELYMELEQLRFNHKFEYEILRDPSIQIEKTHVPSMLLQPFVENAILHGILPMKENGTVTLKLQSHDANGILVTITDNGVGREFHKNKLGKKHKSHGLRITEERLKVFESLLGNKFNLQIRDLKDEQGKAKGTEVELILPCS